MKINFKDKAYELVKRLNNVRNPYPYTKEMISKKFIFIHIPKTAGSSINSILGINKHGRRHLSWRIYQQANRYYFKNFFKFAIVRDPYTRLLSSYNYLKKGGNKKEDLVLAKYLSKHAPDFEAFVINFLDPSKMSLHNLLKPQSYFLCSLDGQIKVDHISKLESLENDFNYVKERLNLDYFELPRLNTLSNHDDVIRKKESIQHRIYDLYKEDYKNFHYHIINE